MCRYFLCLLISTVPKIHRRTLSRNFWRNCFCWSEKGSAVSEFFRRLAASRATLHALRILFTSTKVQNKNIYRKLSSRKYFGFYWTKLLKKMRLRWESMTCTDWVSNSRPLGSSRTSNKMANSCHLKNFDQNKKKINAVHRISFSVFYYFFWLVHKGNFITIDRSMWDWSGRMKTEITSLGQ